MEICAVLMAGGVETRFGPIKKYLGSKMAQKINDRDEILVETIQRSKKIEDIDDNIYIITSDEQKELFDRILNYSDKTAYNYFPKHNYILEPQPKGTAPCILYAALTLLHKGYSANTVMCVFPCDHDIPNDETNMRLYNKALSLAITAAQNQKLVTIGIKPSFPATAYGYISYQGQIKDDLYNVIKFKEKPEIDEAENFIKSGRIWNSGIFIWKISQILEYYKEYYKEYDSFMGLTDYLNGDPKTAENKVKEVYENIKRDSVDLAILDHVPPNKMLVVYSHFKWQDIGKWDALVAVFSRESSIIDFSLVAVDISNRTIYSNGKHIYKKNGVKNFTYNFLNDCFVWLYCDIEKKEKVLKLLLDKEFYGNYKLESIEIDDLYMQVIKKKLYEDELANYKTIISNLNLEIINTASIRYNTFFIIIITAFLCITSSLLYLNKTAFGGISGGITFLMFVFWLLEKIKPSIFNFMNFSGLKKRYIYYYKEKRYRSLGIPID